MTLAPLDKRFTKAKQQLHMVESTVHQIHPSAIAAKCNTEVAKEIYRRPRGDTWSIGAAAIYRL